MEPFRPRVRTWFDGTFCKQWGQKHDTNVIVDHINPPILRRKLPLRPRHARGTTWSLIASLPIAFMYNLFLDRFIAGFTVGAVK